MADGNTKALAVREQSNAVDARVIESIVLRGDISNLSTEERARYYVQQCESLGLNPATQPLAPLTLNGKQILYPTRGATDQLAAIHRITREIIDGPKLMDLNGTKLVYAVCRATHPNGRTETATATVPFTDPVNVLMKCETKAKRRATLSILGLGMLDESELETIPASAKAPAPTVTQQQIATAQSSAANAPVDVEVEADDSPVEQVLRDLESTLTDGSAPTAPALIALLWLSFVPLFRKAVEGDVDELAALQDRASAIVREQLTRLAGESWWSHYDNLIKQSSHDELDTLVAADAEIDNATTGDAVVHVLASRVAVSKAWSEPARKYLRERCSRRYHALLKLSSLAGARTALGNALKSALAKGPPDDGPRGGGAPAPSAPTTTDATDDSDPERAAIEGEGATARAADPFAYEQTLLVSDAAWRKHLASKSNCYEVVSAYRKRDDRFAAAGCSRDRTRATIERIAAIEGLPYDDALHAFASRRYDGRTARRAA